MASEITSLIESLESALNLSETEAKSTVVRGLIGDLEESFLPLKGRMNLSEWTEADLVTYLKTHKEVTVSDLGYAFGGSSSTHEAKLSKLVKSGLLKAVVKTSTRGKGYTYMLADLEESFLPLKGRTTDVRQQISDIDSMDSSYRGLSPAGWRVQFPKDMYPSNETYLGPFPVALVGHEDMSSDEFTEFLGAIHRNVYPRQVSEPVIATRPAEASVDLRRLVRGGDYDRSVEVLCPGSHRAMTGMLVLLDDILNHPLAHQSLYRLKDGGVYNFKDLATSLRRLALELDEPGYSKHTLGNVLDNLSYPFGTSGIF